MEKPASSRRFYRLDNAANLYPAVRSPRRSGIFRVAAILSEEIDPNRLQEALDDTLRRIPSFNVKLRAGLFWHYFVRTDDRLQVHPDVANPFMPFIAHQDQGFLIRVRYHQKTIALDVFHAISDGSGAMTFLKTLVARYLNLNGAKIPGTQGVLDCFEPPKPQESRDAFPAFAGRKGARGCNQRRTFQIDGDHLPPNHCRIIMGTMPVDKLSEKAKNLSISITEYLTAVLLFTLDKAQRHLKNARLLPISVQVPVNLRQFASPDTLRNFSSYVCPGLDPEMGVHTFEEIALNVHHFMKLQVTEKNLRARVAVNVNNELNKFVRPIPLLLKNRVIYMGYKLTGPISYTSAFSNLGVVKIPQRMHPHVRAFDLILGPTDETRVKCAGTGFDGKVRLNFTSAIRESEIERAFFTFLVKQGVPVEIGANQE